MKVLFIQIVTETSALSYLEGLASISAVLKQKDHLTDIIYVYQCIDFNDISRKIVSFNPDVIAFSVVSTTLPKVKRISKLIKKKFPKILIVCGGVHFTLVPEDFVNIREIDAICLGEGEYSLLELVDKLQQKKDYYSTKGFWFRKGKKIIKNSFRKIIENLDMLPLPDRDLFLRSGHLWIDSLPYGFSEEKGLEFIFSRGCPFECTYCSNHALKKFYGPHYVRFKSPSRAIKEIEVAEKDYGADFFLFHDDIFTLKKEWLDSFLNQYKKIGIPFICNIRVGTCDKALLEKLKKAGCRAVFIGVESGDETLRRKLLNRNMTNKQIIDTFRWARELGLQTLAFIMMGFPQETPAKFLNTVSLMEKIRPDQYFLYVFYPYSGTRLFDYCRAQKIIKRTPSEDFPERRDTVLDIPTFPRKDILYYYKNFQLMLSLTNKKNNLFKEFRRKILFYLLAQPPSDKFFDGYQLLFKLDKSFVTIVKNILGLPYEK